MIQRQIKFAAAAAPTLLIALALSMIAVSALAAEIAGQLEAKLRAQPAVSGATITLGDIFDGIGDAGSVTVTASPRPGQSVLIDTKSLNAVLAAHGLSWPAGASYSAIRVERLAREIRTNEIAQAIGTALGRQTGRTLEARIAQNSIALNAPVTSAGGPEVEIVAFDGRSGAFDVIVRAPGGDAARLNGTAEEVMDIPVLARPIQRGETIADADISYMHARIVYLSRNTVTDPKQLIGLAAKRPLQSGQPILSSDIEHPIVIAKGALVTIVYEVPGLSLTDQGRALEQGAVGDSIGVLNPTSHRNLLATVVASDRVRIDPPAMSGASVAQR